MSLKVIACLIFKLVLICELHAAPSRQSPPSTIDEVQMLANCRAADLSPNLSDISFKAHRVSWGLAETACLSLQMFNDAGLVARFNISAPVLARFILQAQRGYQNVPYHNWYHGFSVLQFSFAVIKTCRLFEKNHFSPLEGLALLTAAMCHDLDHPGTNNLFQVEVNNSFAQKYEKQGSILERHHIDMTLNILKNSDTNFVSHFDEYKQNHFKELISQIILATDLQAHLKLLPEMKKMVSAGFSELSEQHRELLRSIIISCADLSDQAKDWCTSRLSARHVLTEFFSQGDQEKRLHLVPSKMMDRDQAEVPQVEVDFLTHVIVPNFQILTSLYPETQTCLDNIQQNLIYWRQCIPYFQEQSNLGRESLNILKDNKLHNVSSLYTISRK